MEGKSGIVAVAKHIITAIGAEIFVYALFFAVLGLSAIFLSTNDNNECPARASVSFGDDQKRIQFILEECDE